jgi:hypothetical protein
MAAYRLSPASTSPMRTNDGNLVMCSASLTTPACRLAGHQSVVAPANRQISDHQGPQIPMTTGKAQTLCPRSGPPPAEYKENPNLFIKGIGFEADV